MAVEMLETLGYGALEASNGAEALALIGGGRGIDAMIIDLGLPDQPGERVIRQVLDLRPGLPVIVATGADTVGARQGLNDCPGVNYLGKPYYFSDLEQALNAALRYRAVVA
jgi:DNA-binding response OmpR family regulator